MRRNKKKEKPTFPSANLMARMMNLNRGGFVGKNKRQSGCRSPGRTIPSVLLMSIFLLIYCFVQPAARDAKGFKRFEVKKNGSRIIRYENSYALLIGVSQYEHWPVLKSVPMEMRLIESSLKKHGFTAETSLNPSGKVLRQTIKDFIDRYGFEKNNRLLIFFSGHGYTREDVMKGYIVPADAVDPLDDEIEFARKAIEMEQILAWAKRIESKHALFVFDSCFSGTILKTRNLPVPEDISYCTGKPVRQFITSGSAGETVPGESYFVECFIRGIDGEADYDNDGYITATELGISLRKKIMQYKCGQTPQYGKIRDPHLDQGDFVFIGKKPAPPPEPPTDKFGPIEGVEIKDNTLIAFDAKGKQRRKTFDSVITCHQLADIDQDGKKDVLVGFKERGKQHSRVMVFDSKKNELNEKWNYMKKPDYPYIIEKGEKFGGFGCKFMVGDLKVFNVRSQKIIVILFRDTPWYPSALVVLNSKGEKLKEFWHPGFMYQVEKIKNVFIIRAVNNHLRQMKTYKNYKRNPSVIFGLKYEHIYGEAPPYLGSLEKNTDFQWYYVLSGGDEEFLELVVLDRKISVFAACGKMFYFNENGKLDQVGQATDYSCEETLRLIRLPLPKK
jgi:hypothetical protein